ncbi:MAG: hypothetical protein M3N53_06755 [Actinomycetota bacterium]|nr:hypothetical protein [Actinomycetota bacterium]
MRQLASEKSLSKWLVALMVALSAFGGVACEEGNGEGGGDGVDTDVDVDADTEGGEGGEEEGDE